MVYVSDTVVDIEMGKLARVLLLSYGAGRWTRAIGSVSVSKPVSLSDNVKSSFLIETETIRVM